MSRAARLAREVQEMFRAADAEGRPLTADRTIYAEERLAEAKATGSLEKIAPRTRRGDRSAVRPGQRRRPGVQQRAAHGNPRRTADDPGSRFINSDGYKSLFGPGAARGREVDHRPDRDSPRRRRLRAVQGHPARGRRLPRLRLRRRTPPGPAGRPGRRHNALPATASGGSAPERPAAGNTVRYIREGTATSGAAGVAEGGTKPESILGLSTKDEPVKKVATFLPVSDELLEDATVRAVVPDISGLGLFVNIEVERQLLRGTSGGNEVQGLLTSRSVPVYTGGTADNEGGPDLQGDELHEGLGVHRARVDRHASDRLPDY